MADGYCVYQGEASQSAKHFRKIGFHLPTFSNPADTFMRILAVSYPKTDKDERKLSFLNEQYVNKMKY